MVQEKLFEKLENYSKNCKLASGSEFCLHLWNIHKELVSKN